MARRGHTEEQILRALRQAESGTKVSEISREQGISETTYYIWKKRYAGLGLSELRELRRCARRTLSSSGWSPIYRWTGTGCRRSSEKSCKASPSARVGSLGASRL